LRTLRFYLALFAVKPSQFILFLLYLIAQNRRIKLQWNNRDTK